MSRGNLRFKELVWVSRPKWWLVTAVAFFIGSRLATDELSVTLIIGTLYFLLPYNLLVHALNDIFDYEDDINNQRKKVLPKIKHPALLRWTIGLNAPILGYLCVVGNIESNVFLFMMVYMALAYSAPGLRYKGIPFIDSLTAGFHYTAPFLLGLFIFESPELWAPVFAGLYFWAVASHTFGTIKDIKPDKEAGIKTTGVYLGPAKTLYLTIMTFGLAILPPVLEYGLSGAIAVLLISPYLLTVLITFPHRFNGSEDVVFKTAWIRYLRFHYLVFSIGYLAFIYLYNK